MKPQYGISIIQLTNTSHSSYTHMYIPQSQLMSFGKHPVYTLCNNQHKNIMSTYKCT